MQAILEALKAAYVSASFKKLQVQIELLKKNIDLNDPGEIKSVIYELDSVVDTFQGGKCREALEALIEYIEEGEEDDEEEEGEGSDVDLDILGDGLSYEDMGWCPHGCADDEECEECANGGGEDDFGGDDF